MSAMAMRAAAGLLARKPRSSCRSHMAVRRALGGSTGNGVPVCHLISNWPRNVGTGKDFDGFGIVFICSRSGSSTPASLAVSAATDGVAFNLSPRLAMRASLHPSPWYSFASALVRFLPARSTSARHSRSPGAMGPANEHISDRSGNGFSTAPLPAASAAAASVDSIPRYARAAPAPPKTVRPCPKAGSTPAVKRAAFGAKSALTRRSPASRPVKFDAAAMRNAADAKPQ
mmetsp:Transcript_5999/g.18939  ORF Transcript_5999/g.18939 Transcript_5999/m.18939 type:complete len:230 (-) Transcript_5999:18-707(-)